MWCSTTPVIVGLVVGDEQLVSVLVSTPHCLRVTIAGRGGIPVGVVETGDTVLVGEAVAVGEAVRVPVGDVVAVGEDVVVVGDVVAVGDAVGVEVVRWPSRTPWRRPAAR